MRPSSLLTLGALLWSCQVSSATQRSSGTAHAQPLARPQAPGLAPMPAPRPTPPPEHAVPPKIKNAEDHATPGGRAVLAAARKMIAEDVVVKGSCWDYANAVYGRAGFQGWRKQKIPFRSRTKGPYADPRLVQAGDWLYIINHAPTLSTHSLIFVHWVDLARRDAKVITYVGGGREEPGMYRSYNLSMIYQIVRPKPPATATAPATAPAPAPANATGPARRPAARPARRPAARPARRPAARPAPRPSRRAPP